jgi:3-hydroxyisobutyrate dehydrogenase-like beta-hydroxyacid dehydrogenase
VSENVAMVGYGEVGRIFSAALVQSGVRAVKAFDVLVSDAQWAAEARACAARDGVHLASDLSEAVADADLVICAVTAAASATAAKQIAKVVRKESFVLDVNSASPRTKKACADAINGAGGRYVEAAVMSSVPPHGIRAPMLLGGPHAQALQPTLARLGFDAPVGSTDYGVVSAIKLCRSVVIKGMEALAVESLLTARRYGVEKEVLASLAQTHPGLDWTRQADYLWRRVVQHGRRRAEEMREAALAVADAGGSPRMASATAEVQSWMATLRTQGVFGATGKDAGWRELADAIDAVRPAPCRGGAS